MLFLFYPSELKVLNTSHHHQFPFRLQQMSEPSIQITNAKVRQPLKLCHPERTPDFLHAAPTNGHVCGFLQGKPHEVLPTPPSLTGNPEGAEGPVVRLSLSQLPIQFHSQGTNDSRPILGFILEREQRHVAIPQRR
jgi:hypothetical protein